MNCNIKLASDSNNLSFDELIQGEWYVVISSTEDDFYPVGSFFRRADKSEDLGVIIKPNGIRITLNNYYLKFGRYRKVQKGDKVTIEF